MLYFISLLCLLPFLPQVCVKQESDRVMDYCKDVLAVCTEGGKKNIVCERKNNCGLTDNCQEVSLHKDVKDFIVDSINELRNLVAFGQAHLQGEFSAMIFREQGANMRALSWDDELAYIAQCAVNVCEKRLEGHCPISSKYKQPHILYSNRSDVSFDDEFDFFNESVQEWAMDMAHMLNTNDIKPERRNFATMTFHEQRALGCGLSRVIKPILYHNHNAHYYFAACVFSHVPKTAIFRLGYPCTKCPNGTACNTQYKGLCGEVIYAHRNLKENDYDFDKATWCYPEHPLFKLLVAIGFFHKVHSFFCVT